MTTPNANTGRLVSVKFNPVGRAQTFVADDLPADVTLRPGDSVVVHADGGPAVGYRCPCALRRLPNGAGRPPIHHNASSAWPRRKTSSRA